MPVYPKETIDQALYITQGVISENNKDQIAGLSINNKTIEKLILPKDITSEETFIAIGDLKDEETGVTLFRDGDEIEIGTFIKGNWNVKTVDVPTEIKLVDKETGTETPYSPPEEDEEEIIDGPSETPSGMDVQVDANLYEDYEARTEWLFGYCSDAGMGFSCDEKDELVCLGHLWDDTRQNAIVLSSTDPVDPELNAPAIAQYNGIDTFGESISKFRMTAIAANGNEFIGSFLIKDGDTYLDVNHKIEMYINDVKSGLETVGIHLDGDNSTIKVIGSVDLKQHSSDSYDTLNLYDNLDTKRLEISPFEVPQITDQSSGIDISNKNFGYYGKWFTATSDYIRKDKWKDWQSPFTYKWEYVYELKNYIVNCSTSINLGYIKAGNIIDISKLQLKLQAMTYLVNSVYVDHHKVNHLGDDSNLKQQITTLNYTLKKNGKNMSGYSNINILPSATINNIDTEKPSISLSSAFLNDLVIAGDGTYTLEITVGMRVYAYHLTYSNYSNYYYGVFMQMSGSAQLAVQPYVATSNDMSNRKMTIGTNGFIFTGNNSRYFSSSTNGYNFRWDDAEFIMDSNNGLKMNKLYKVMTSGGTMEGKYDVFICNYSSGGYACTLPSASHYGNGRVLYIIGFQGLTLNCSSGDTVKLAGDTSILDYTQVKLASASGIGYLGIPKATLQLLAANGAWYVLSYV